MPSLQVNGKAKRDGRGHQQQGSRLQKTPPLPNIPLESQLSRTTNKGRLIVGIDLGTTRCAVASAEVFGNSPDIEVKVNDFSTDSYAKPLPFPPTQLYYKENSRLPATGSEVKKILKASTTRRQFDSDRLFRLWKLMFHNHFNDPSIKELQTDIQRQLRKLGKTPYDLLHDWVEVKYEEIFEGLRHLYPRFDKLDIEIVVAVPPGRSTVVHDKVLDCFVQGRIKSNAVSLASEPASMFCSWVYESTKKQDWKVGHSYLVADGGGGTCCFVRFRLDRLERLEFTQQYESESVICGAETISTSFMKLASSKVPLDFPDRDWQLERMRRVFDRNTKNYFGTRDNMGCSIAKSENEESFWKFSHEEIAACFKFCIDKLIEGIRRQMAKDGHPADTIVLGGGLFANQYVRKAVEKAFLLVKILMPSSDKGHVAMGAVRDRSLGNFIKSCSFTRCKAIGTFMLVTNKIKKLPFFKKLFTQNGVHDKKKYIYVAEFLAKKGDSANSLVGEKSAETLPKNARVRHLGDNSDLELNETIMTFDYEPDIEDEWVMYCKDKTWVDHRGMPVPLPERSDTITWDIEKDGGFEGNFVDLDSEKKNGQEFRILRYTLQMKFSEMQTLYWIKVWSSERLKARTGNPVAFLSYPMKREALYTPHEVSRSLAESFKLEDENCHEDRAQRNHISTPQVASVKQNDRNSNKVQLKESMNISRPQVGQASTKMVRPSVETSRHSVSSLATSPSEHSLSRVGAPLDNISASQTLRSKRRKIQHTPKAGMIAWSDVGEEALNK